MRLRPRSRNQPYFHLPRPLSILGIPVHPFKSYAHASACVDNIVSSGGKSWWIAINGRKVYTAIHNAQIRAAIDRSHVGTCDATSVMLAAKLLYGQAIKRCTGIDLFITLIDTAAQKGWKVFLLGASPEVNEMACSNLRKKYPGLKIVGRRDGYFQDSSAVAKQINASKADLLFVAMGSPRQELWIAHHFDMINVSFCMGVGGTFDVVSGKAVRAPKIFRRTGTEFLFRNFTNPKKLKGIPLILLFMMMVIQRMLSGRKGLP